MTWKSTSMDWGKLSKLNIPPPTCGLSFQSFSHHLSWHHFFFVQSVTYRRPSTMASLHWEFVLHMLSSACQLLTVTVDMSMNGICWLIRRALAATVKFWRGSTKHLPRRLPWKNCIPVTPNTMRKTARIINISGSSKMALYNVSSKGFMPLILVMVLSGLNTRNTRKNCMIASDPDSRNITRKLRMPPRTTMKSSQFQGSRR